MEPLIWLGVYLLELVFYSWKTFWKIRIPVAYTMLVLVALSTFLLLRLDSSLWFAVIVGFSLFRMFNFGRIIIARMHSEYMRLAVGRTSMMLAFMTSFAITFAVPFVYLYVDYFVYIQIIVAGSMLTITLRNIYKLKYVLPGNYLVDRELPTVTLAVPARNETADLEKFLYTALDSDYPKLEILVLDDCSQDKTADIIKSFAHAGVRFIKGLEPNDRWLAKNHAYEKLYQEASGEYILFCGVDVRLGRKTIRSMVNLLKARNKSMLSVMPVRSKSTPSSAFIQPMRYWWELVLPRRIFNRPPVLSTCWMIERRVLKKFGGFGSVSHTLVPEGYLARELVKNDKYSFVRSSNDLEVSTEKSLSDQRETAIRTLYPKIRKRPENTLFLTIVSGLFLLGPFVGLLASFWVSKFNMTALVIACLLLIATHMSVVYSTDSANMLLAGLTYPVAIIVELIFGYVSMIQYEFYTISWKERNICIPVMHVVPSIRQLQNIKQ